MNKDRPQLLVIFKEMNRLLNSTYGQETFDLEKFKLFVHHCLAEKTNRRSSMLLKHGESLSENNKRLSFMKTVSSDNSQGIGLPIE